MSANIITAKGFEVGNFSPGSRAGDNLRLAELRAAGFLSENQIELIRKHYVARDEVLFVQTHDCMPIRAIVIGSVRESTIKIEWFWVHPDMPWTQSDIESLKQKRVPHSQHGR